VRESKNKKTNEPKWVKNVGTPKVNLGWNIIVLFYPSLFSGFGGNVKSMRKLK
jgi:hypothetical protein